MALAAPVQPVKQVVVQADPATTGEGAQGVVPLGHASPPTPEPAPPKRAPAHYLWAVLIARIYEVFPLVCPMCAGQMRIIAFITHSADIHRILDHIGMESQPPPIAPARGLPMWDDCDAHSGEGTQIESDWDLAAQPAPDYEVDQRLNWWLLERANFMPCGARLPLRQPKNQRTPIGFNMEGLGPPKPLKSRVLGCPKPMPYLASCG